MEDVQVGYQARERRQIMKIKQAEELVGITSKNIRFYEEQGLLQPQRTENGYRDYGQEDVKVLKRIKLFRKLGIPVEEIHKLFQGKLSLNECLKNQEIMLRKEQENIEKMCILTQEIYEQFLSVDELDSDVWLEKMEKLEKEGVDFVNLNKIDIHMKKKLGALAGAGIMIAIMMIILGALVYGFTQDTNFPVWAFLLFAIPICAVIIGAIVAMKSRMNEIDKGEEDEAAKY